MSGTLKIAGTTLATNPTNSKVVIDDAVSAKGIAVAGGVFNGAHVDSTSNLDHVAYSFGISGVIDTADGIYQVTLSNPYTNYIVLTKHLFVGGNSGPGFCDVLSIDSTTQFTLQVITNIRDNTTDSTVYFIVFAGS